MFEIRTLVTTTFPWKWKLCCTIFYLGSKHCQHFASLGVPVRNESSIHLMENMLFHIKCSRENKHAVWFLTATGRCGQLSQIKARLLLSPVNISKCACMLKKSFKPTIIFTHCNHKSQHTDIRVSAFSATSGRKSESLEIS